MYLEIFRRIECEILAVFANGGKPPIAVTGDYASFNSHSRNPTKAE
jgi:hypothetical protein